LNPQTICDQLGFKLKLGKRLNFKRSCSGSNLQIYLWIWFLCLLAFMT